MSKFKFKMKLEGLEIEMEGSKDDIPLMASSLGNHLAGLMQPATEMPGVSNGSNGPGGIKTIDHAEREVAPARKRKRSTSSQSAKDGSSDAIEWQHDSTKYGNPQQAWNPTKKALWLLYVVSQEVRLTQISASQITNTFNKKFKQAGVVRGSNISRDLGKAKTRSPSLTGENTTKNPSEWYLTEAGVREAQAAVAEVKSS